MPLADQTPVLGVTYKRFTKSRVMKRVFMSHEPADTASKGIPLGPI